MVLCAIATPIWWGTPPETLVHNSAHFVMMMSGIMSLVINWNPLMKLDGYYLLTDLVGIQDLKEASTAYTSALVKNRFWKLPVEVPYVPKQRRIGFVVYAVASGVYSYTVLFVVARFAGNFVRNFSPEWGFIPEIGVALLVFRSRIRLLGNFMKFLYLDKKDRILVWFTPKHTAMAAAIVGLLLAIPVWKESVIGKFVLEPVSQAVVRARVPGTLSKIFVREGERVSQGSTLGILENVPMQSNLHEAKAKLMLASALAREAERNYQGYGDARMEQERSAKQAGQMAEMEAALELKAPITGTVVTPKVQDLLGAYLKLGSELVTIADTSQMRARISISEYDMYKIQAGQAAKLQLDGAMSRKDGKVSLVSARPAGAPTVGSDEADPEAVHPHQYYSVDIVVANPGGELKPGMLGTARVYGSRRSLGGMALEGVKNFWGRKLW